MKASALRTKSLAELRTELEGLLREQFKLRMKHGAGQLPQFHQLAQARRDVARVRTVIQQKISSGETQ